MSLTELTRILWYVSIGLTILLLIRLWRQGLISTYRVLAAFLGWEVFTAVVLANVRYGTNLYAQVFFVFQPLTCLFYVLTTLELMTQVLRHYPGFAALGRRLISYALGIGTCLALVSMVAGVNTNTSLSAVWPMSVFLLGRVVCLTVLGFVAASSILFRWFPLPLPLNATRFLIGYSVCFAARTLSYLAMTLRGFSVADQASFLFMSVVLCCQLYWIVRLSREGEETGLAVNPKLTNEQQQRILEQMQTINASLIRARNK